MVVVYDTFTLVLSRNITHNFIDYYYVCYYHQVYTWYGSKVTNIFGISASQLASIQLNIITFKTKTETLFRSY